MAFVRGAQLISQATRALSRPAAQPALTRGFAGGHGHTGEAVTYAGLTLHKPSFADYAASKVIGGGMWFWIFFMLYNEWDHKMLGLAGIFEKEGDDDEHGDHGHH